MMADLRIQRPPARPSPPPPIDQLLDRPAADRLREYRYRFAQSLVFGLPVVGLEWYGYQLGGAEAERWIGIFAALLAGWVLYVAAAGMLFEGLLLIRRRLSGDMLISGIAVVLYLYSLVSVLHLFVAGTLWYRPLLFHWSVMLLAVWTGFQWWRQRRIVDRQSSRG